jgi:hypothetical protein
MRAWESSNSVRFLLPEPPAFAPDFIRVSEWFECLSFTVSLIYLNKSYMGCVSSTAGASEFFLIFRCLTSDMIVGKNS